MGLRKIKFLGQMMFEKAFPSYYKISENGEVLFISIDKDSIISFNLEVRVFINKIPRNTANIRCLGFSDDLKIIIANYDWHNQAIKINVWEMRAPELESIYSFPNLISKYIIKVKENTYLVENMKESLKIVKTEHSSKKRQWSHSKKYGVYTIDNFYYIFIFRKESLLVRLE